MYTEDHNGSPHLKRKEIRSSFTAADLQTLQYMDVNSDTAYKLLHPDTAKLLDEHLPHHTLGTSICIRMIHYLMAPYKDVTIGSPVDAVCSIATGLTFLRLWKKYLELNKCCKRHETVLSIHHRAD